jgi:hypothetical protein
MGLTRATSYEFRIQAHNADGWSEWSYASATTLPLPEVPPLAPTLYADPASDMAVRVKWLAVERATGYELERKNLNGAWERIAVVALVTDYMDEGLQPSTLYAYRIRAGNEYGLSPYSNEAGAKTLAVPHPPEVPLLNGGAASQTQVQLFWEPVPGAQAYRLEKKNAAGGWDVIYETVAGPLRYHDEGLQSSTTYTYQLGALNGAGAWIYSAELVTKTYPRPLTEALVVSARAMSSSAIELSWAPMELAETYWVGKWVDGDWVFTVLGANATNYIETGLRAGTTYMFRVYGMNLVSSSPHVDMSVTTWGAMDGEIVIQSMQVEGGMSRMVLGGNTGQRFVVEGTSDFATWRDLTETLRLSDGMEVEVAVGSEAMIFYRTRRVD